MPTKIKGTTGVDKVEAGAVITNPSFSGNATVTGSLTVGGVNVFSGPYRNRIINGDMRIDQRNLGTWTNTTADTYNQDRWFFTSTQASKYTVQQSTDAPAGFSNSMLITSSSAYSLGTGDTFLLNQRIEGYNTAHLESGTADAKTVTLSFYVKSSLTGTFGGAICNGAFNRSYPFSYTIDSANTWERKSITFTCDTTGTWVGSTNGIGMVLRLGLGSGSTYTGTAGAWVTGNIVQTTGSQSIVSTSGATWQITGVQLEVGEGASDFEFLPYDVQLARCQRYYYKSPAGYSYGDTWIVYQASTGFLFNGRFPVTMRTNPSITFGWSTPYTGNTIYRIDSGQVITVTVTSLPTTPDKPTLIFQAGTHSLVVGTSWSTWITASAEL